MTSIHSPALLRRAVVLAVALALAAPALVPSEAEAQAAYPSKPVTFIVPFPPGGGTDISARTVAAKLTALWAKSGGANVIVENRGGAGGILGADAVAKARPDGYTLLIANVGTQSINPSLYPKLPVQPGYRLRADIAHLRAAVRADGEPVAQGELGQGARGLRQGQSRQGDVRELRQRRLAAPDRGDLPARHRHASCCTSPTRAAARR